MITEKAFAKINLTLKITGKREDGYHNLESVMQTVSLCDTLFLTKSAGGIGIDCGDIPGKANIAHKAAAAFFKAAGVSKGVTITLKKHIPIGGGLGGGSADAAAVLRGLNRLYETCFSAGKLREIAVSLGMDVPFLIEGGTCFCEGAGEKLTPIRHFENIAYLICFAGGGVSTAKMYAEMDKNPPPAAKTEWTRPAFLRGDAAEVAANLHNDFLPVFLNLYPENKTVVQRLYENGAAGVSLTGSGSGFFGVFSSLEKAKAAENEMKKYGFAQVVTPVKALSAGG